jgi:hypothetical protein
MIWTTGRDGHQSSVTYLCEDSNRGLDENDVPRVQASPSRTEPAERKRIGRPRVAVPSELVVKLRQAGWSWAQIARTTGAGAGTVRRAFREATNPSQPCQNSPADIV